ncbi:MULTISPECIES: hypothetical protein [Bacillus cereus group]|uniref:Uncharacterized protein n=1 Tax=Bacillus thuringiensis TaxID=1428 RepID=A0A1C4E1V5_BACTU|nr:MULTISPECIES: hypothetical protein [Bacillus cereus group]MED3025637.1 hypothetical protein [Bacillus wiedmannii]SCC37495.1 Uncharacterized protein BTT61001_02824 [Bacillus thuringiensis]
MIALREQVKQICARLAPHGWGDLFWKHNLDITASNLEEELEKELDINRTIKGFEDFSLEGKRGIESGQPARSLLYHALASPNVTIGVDDSELGVFPTLAELEIIENYVFGINPPRLSDIKCRLEEGETLAVVVFASEYRSASETVHQKHADLCFSRTGVARVGTAEPMYVPKNRGFFSDDEGDDYAFRVLPSKYSAYIAVKRQGNKDEFGPMRFKKEDETADNIAKKTSDTKRWFWVPLHKIFSGLECLHDDNGEPINLEVNLQALHINEKIRRIHQVLHEAGYNTGSTESDINKPPFVFYEGIAEWSNNPEFGSNLLMPIPHCSFIEPAIYKKKPLTFIVPKIGEQCDKGERDKGLHICNFSSSLEIRYYESDGSPKRRPAPEYVHVRHKILENGTPKNLNHIKNQNMVKDIINEGNYRALHYVDYTGDGWIEVECPQLKKVKGLSQKTYAAYSIVAGPDFFPNCDQRELMDWYEKEIPDNIRNVMVIEDGVEERISGLWESEPLTLSDDRIPANVTFSKKFDVDDNTITAIVSQLYMDEIKHTNSSLPTSIRHSFLPDAASGVYAPGWDVSYDETQDGKPFLAAYGLGSPFPEDAKLCAALSTFWPAVAPDSARNYEPNRDNITFPSTYEPQWPTIAPLTDREIGQEGELPWDGVSSGPDTIITNGEETIECTSIDYVDYVDTALQNKFTLSLTKLINVEEYKNRVLAMAYVYLALGLSLKDSKGIDEKRMWNILSFREVSFSDEELLIAQTQAKNSSFGKITERKTVYRFELFQHTQTDKKHPCTDKATDFSKYQIKISNKTICFVNGTNILVKHENSNWQAKVIKDWEISDV